MKDSHYNESGNNKLNSDIENKVDLLLDQQECVQRAIAHLKADLPDIMRETITAVLTKRAAKGNHNK